MYIRIAFIILGIIFFTLFSVYKMYLCKLKRTDKTSVFVSCMGGTLLLYIVSAFLGVIFFHGAINKMIMLFFAVFPFIIGKIVTYERENMYSIIQLGIIAISIIYAIIM